MANTTNFGWETPDDTDLVKDGAAAMRTLGNAIDTSFVDLKGGTTGQILSKASNTDLDYTWITNDVGDITAVTAGTGITGGGTSGAVTITNDMATKIDAKGDLVVGTGADAYDRLAVGTNNYVLTADSTQATGLKWAASASVPDSYGFTAGKNKIINGDFFINQRAFSGSSGFNFDRWALNVVGGTTTMSSQNFTLGAAPVAGYEGKTFFRAAISGQSAAGDLCAQAQKIESVRTFAGQTVTISFWAKASSGTPSIAVELQQNFGTGGSPSTAVNTGTTKQAITTSWARYSYQITVPSISGKTIGTNNDDCLTLFIWLSAGSNFNSRTDTLGIQNNTFDIWGVQVEAGSTATSFQTATGNPQGELAACQRYYYKHLVTEMVAVASATGTAVAQTILNFPVTMRIAPTITLPASGSSTGQIAFLKSDGNYPTTIGTLSANRITVGTFCVYTTNATSAFTGGNASILFVTGTNQTAYEASAEL